MGPDPVRTTGASVLAAQFGGGGCAESSPAGPAAATP